MLFLGRGRGQYRVQGEREKEGREGGRKEGRKVSQLRYIKAWLTKSSCKTTHLKADMFT